MMKRVITVCLVCIIVFSSATVSFADDNDYEENILTETAKMGIAGGCEHDLSIARTVSGNVIVVTVTDDADNLLAQAIRNGSMITVSDYSNPSNPTDVTIELEEGLNLAGAVFDGTLPDDTKSITWGSWTSSTKTFHVAGMTAVVVVATIASCFVGVPVAVFDDLLILFASFPYQYATVKVRMRLGTDEYYQYTQVETTVWGRNTANGTMYKMYGPVLRTSKKSLNSK